MGQIKMKSDKLKNRPNPVNEDIFTPQSAQRHFFSAKMSGEEMRGARLRKAEHLIGILREEVAQKDIERALSIGSSFCVIEVRLKEEFFPEAEFICTDLDEEALNYFEQPGLSKKVMSATSMDLEDGSFDFIIAHQVLEHINDYPKALDILARLCRYGGIIYINVPNPFSPVITKGPDGKWKRPYLRSLIRHNLKKFRPDFMSNTEKYHTGFSKRTLKKHFPNFRVIDKRKERLKQEFKRSFMKFLIGIFPNCLLFLVVPTNIWVLVKRPLEEPLSNCANV